MKTAFFAATLVLSLLFGNVAHSQAPGVPQTAVQRLQAIRAKNKELLDRQTATLKKLEEIQLEAQQLKFLGKRA